MGKLQGKTAIVTGAGRQQGIGAAICRTLASEGANVFFTYFYEYDQDRYPDTADADWPERFAQELREFGIRVGHASADLSKPGAGIELLSRAREQIGVPNVLVNNAAYGIDADFRQLTDALIDAHCAVNMRGTFMLAAEFARMIEAEQQKGDSSVSADRGARILNMTSGQGKGPMPGNLIYAATKGAISVFTESLAAELAPLHITVNAVDPGPTDSGWMDEDFKKQILPAFPMGRIGLPEDAARLIAFLASDDACWITGQIIHSRGGF